MYIVFHSETLGAVRRLWYAIFQRNSSAKLYEAVVKDTLSKSRRQNDSVVAFMSRRRLCLVGHFLSEPDYVTFGSLLSQFRLSVCRLSPVSVTLVHPTHGLKLSAIFLHRCVRWPSSDLHTKFYGDIPRGTPPSGALNARGVSKYSDFGPIEGYIS